MINSPNTPTIRFKGFADVWEQRKFEEAFIERREKTEQENEDTLLSCAINGMFLNSELFGHFRGTTTIGYLRVKKNDLILSAQNLHLGNANVNLRFEHGIISPAYKVYDLNKCNPEFIQAWVKKDDTKNFFLAATTEGASQCRKNIEWETLGKQTIPMPSIDEQKQIGAFFKQLDHLITLHQRKLEKLTNIKKSMLEKMFPQNGSSHPEIRFKGFTDAWEQRKLGDICSRVQGNDGRMNLPTLTISAANGWMNQEERFSGNIAGKEQKNYTLLHKGELSYNHGNSKLAKYGTVFSLQTYEEALVPRVYHSFRVENGSADFLEYYFATKLPDRELGRLISSGARMDGLLNIGYYEFMGIQMMFPTIAEQNQIAGYFRCLDTLITLHQRELDHLKLLKKGMLQQMFV